MHVLLKYGPVFQLRMMFRRVMPSSRCFTNSSLLSVCLLILLVGCDNRSVMREKVLYDFKSPQQNPAVYVTGLGEIERSVGTNTVSEWRWAYGEKTQLTFVNQKTEQAYVAIKLCNPIVGQAIAVKMNGFVVQEWKNVPRSETMKPTVEARINVTLSPGVNTLEVQFERWNGFNAVVSETDSRPFAAAFFELRLTK
jgi:hypothetical protein